MQLTLEKKLIKAAKLMEHAIECELDLDKRSLAFRNRYFLLKSVLKSIEEKN